MKLNGEKTMETNNENDMKQTNSVEKCPEIVRLRDFAYVEYQTRLNHLVLGGVEKEASACCIKVGINIDENKLADWIKMCVEIEVLPEEWRQRWACEKQINLLNEMIRSLEQENRSLSGEIRDLKECITTLMKN